ncbi:methyl-accepting chemotaxis protein [Hyalangium rubrum]|uniref:Methyl-accepting chemotaxis protein n=1 Tax=Hyalangium rubrum TaxID=3103134 RepID=A0ABU5H8T8_9BACT|nr:methyl-accepting chemotaxis protein [Hyalangium sp. s54d21]MDY7229274.1 methyl-accepting chemotaxis protein [Hyalangium sp. s54d21]
MKLSLAARVTAAFLLVVLVLTFGSVALVAMSLRTSFEEGLVRSLEQDIAGWRSLLVQEGRVLSAAARGAVGGSVLHAVLTSDSVDRETLQGIADEQRSLMGVDLFLLLDPEGKVRAGSLTGPLPRELSALLGAEHADLLMVEEVPYWSLVRPVEANGRVVGHLAMGIRLGEGLLRRLREQSGAETVLMVKGNVSASSLTSVAIENVLAALPSTGEPGRFLYMKGTRNLAARVEMGEDLRLVLVRSGEAEFARFQVTLLALLGLGLAGAIGAGSVAFLLARRVTGPLRQLTAAAARVVAEGDFRGTLQVRSRDEIGELASSFGQMMGRLRDVLLALRTASEQLESAASQLSSEAVAQNRDAARQAAALYETRVTAEQLQRASQLAAQRAKAVLKGAERADALGRAGEIALEGSLGGLAYIRNHVDQIASTSQELELQTKQIGGITQTVKDLADQSNMLALNAAIEAARSGEHGQGFAVVAREIRTLADKSASATRRVQEILSDIARAISATVGTSESGVREVEGGLAQVRATGESLRALAAIVHDHRLAVREIADTASQQDAGIAQLFIALSELSSFSQETASRLAGTEEAADRLSTASREVSAIVRRYKL